MPGVREGQGDDVKRAGQKRRVFGWVLLAVGWLVAVAWVVSGWWRISLDHDDWRVECLSGTLNFFDTQFNEEPGWPLKVDKISIEHDKHRYKWRIWSQSLTVSPNWDAWVIAYEAPTILGGTTWQVGVVLWPFACLLWTCGGLALWFGRRARRRALTNHCPACGYNLAGLGVDATCPECGKAR